MATCKTSIKNQQLDFQHTVVTYPFPLEFIPTMKELKQKRDKVNRTQVRRRQKLIDTRTPAQLNTQRQLLQNRSRESINKTSKTSTLSNEDREILPIENQQFVEDRL